MKRYLLALLITTLLLIIVAFSLTIFAPSMFSPILPAIVIYFSAITLLEHIFIVNSAKKSPRTFIKSFLGSTMAVLFVHIIVMATWMFTHRSDLHQLRVFIVGFCICYMAYLAYETIALVLFIRRRRKEVSKPSDSTTPPPPKA